MERVTRQSPRIIVIGGGLAGLAASAALTDAGLDVTLIERRRLLGGRATSFEDAATGRLLDNCQHVLLGCCTNLLHLYRTLGIEDRIELFDRITFADETGRRGSLAAGPLPSPLHLAPAMLRFPLLSAGEKIEIARAMGAMKLIDDEAAADDQTFGQWLAEHDQSPRTIARFWNVIVTSALNEDVSRASARYGIQVFREAFLGHRRGYVMGVPAVPLAQLYEGARATRLLTGVRAIALRRVPAKGPTPSPLGGEGRGEGSFAPVAQMTPHPDPLPQVEKGPHAWRIELSTGQSLDADIVILATAPDAARRLLAGVCELPGLDRLTFRPILGLHLLFDRPVMSEPHLALIGTELQWLFRKEAGHIHGVISAADRQAEEPNDVLVNRLLAEVNRLLPDSRSATLLASRIVKEKRATFSPLPGIDRLRPSQATALPGLFLAGDYTRTGWPATMEGAVRSGYLAAEAVLRCLGRPATLLQPDL